MNKIQDYNIKLLDALNSWFWYNGLLDSVDDEWVAFENISRPKYDENCLILKLISILRETEDDILTLSSLEEKYNKFYGTKELKSQIIPKTRYEYGLFSFKSICLSIFIKCHYYNSCSKFFNNFSMI